MKKFVEKLMQKLKLRIIKRWLLIKKRRNIREIVIIKILNKEEIREKEKERLKNGRISL